MPVPEFTAEVRHPANPGPLSSAKILAFTTTDGSFEGDELPTGEIIVRGETTADTFWESRFAVEACGMETITGISETGRTAEWTVEEIRDAVRGSAREFGEDSIPLSLASFLEDGPLPDWQSERLSS